MNNPPLRAPAILLSLVGIIFSAILIYHYAEATSGVDTGPSFCAISADFDCDAVARSSFATVAGIPIASFAFIYYTVLFGLSLSAHRNPSPKKDSALFALAAISLLPTAFYLAVSAIVLKTFCLYCLVLDINNVCLFIVGWRLLPGLSTGAALSTGLGEISQFVVSAFKGGEYSGMARRTLAVLILLAAGLYCTPDILMAKIVTDKTGSNVEDSVAKSLYQQWLRTPALALEFSSSTDWKDREHSKGPANAPIVVVEFADYECPMCRKASGELHQVLANFPEVKFIFKDFPLDRACNRYMDHDLHQSACKAARMTRCAEQQSPEMYWKMSQAIFQAPFMTDSSLDEIPKTLGVESSAFQECLKSTDSLVSIQRDVELAHNLGIMSTPSILVNGKKLEYFQPAALRRILQQLTKSPAKS